MSQISNKVRIIAPGIHQTEAVGWCIDKFGVDRWYPSHEVWTCGYVGDENGKQIVDYKFADSNNAVEFALRWHY